MTREKGSEIKQTSKQVLKYTASWTHRIIFIHAVYFKREGGRQVLRINIHMQTIFVWRGHRYLSHKMMRMRRWLIGWVEGYAIGLAPLLCISFFTFLRFFDFSSNFLLFRFLPIFMRYLDFSIFLPFFDIPIFFGFFFFDFS